MGGISIHHRAWYFLRNEHDVGDPDEAAEWYNVPFMKSTILNGPSIWAGIV